MEHFTGLFGVDVAVKKLRPDAEFALSNNTFIEWDCPNYSKPPTWDEINEQIEKDKSVINTSIEVD
tara:strand:+ start:474 stop:671 length:198 start_codon:yes stop_codon:yes gene_type:complete